MIQLDILTPNRTLLQTQCIDVYLPGFDGEMGVLDMHENFVTLLGTGIVRIQTESGVEEVGVRGGFVEVEKDTITLLADEACVKKDIFKEQVQNQLLKVEEQLKLQADQTVLLDQQKWLLTQMKLIESKN